MQQIPLKELSEYLSQHTLLDARTPEDFLQGTIKNAIYLGPEFKDYYPFDPEQTILILSSKSIPSSYSKTSIPYFIVGEYQSFQKAKLPIEIVIEIDADEFALDYRHDKKIEVIDIRPKDQYRSLHLERSVNTSIQDLATTITEYELDDAIYLVADDLHDNLFAASLMKYHGFQNVRVLNDPFASLQETNITLVRPKKK